MKRNKKPNRTALMPAPVAEFSQLLKEQELRWRGLFERFSTSTLSVGISEVVIDPFLLEPVVERFLKEGRTDGVRDDLTELRGWIAAEKSRVALLFEQSLREFCEENHLPLEGRYPSYIVGNFVGVEVQPSTNECVVDDKKVPSLMFESVVPVLEKALAEEGLNDFAPEAFIEQLFNACRRAAVIDGSLLLDGIPIRFVFRELLFLRQETAFFKNPIRINFREYSLKSFGRDLSRLMAAGVTVTKAGERLNLGPTSTADGIAIRYEGAARNIGRVGFAPGDR